MGDLPTSGQLTGDRKQALQLTCATVRALKVFGAFLVIASRDGIPKADLTAQVASLSDVLDGL